MAQISKFLHDNALVHKARSMRICSAKLGVVEVKWPAESPDTNPTEVLLGGARIGLFHPKSVSELTSVLVAEQAHIRVIF